MAGTVKLNAGGKRYKIERFIPHKGFDWLKNISNIGFQNDIGLILLKDSIQYTDKIKSIILSNQTVRTGSACLATGWGLKKGWGQIKVYLIQFFTIFFNLFSL